MGESATQPCGCPMPVLDGLFGAVDPSCELLLVVDGRGVVRAAHPHASALVDRPMCHAPELLALFPADEAHLIADRVDVVRAARRPTSLDLPRLELRARIFRTGDEVAVLLHGVAGRAEVTVDRALHSDDSFWQLFDAAPLPLAIEVAQTPTGEGASRFNRRFTEVFGYTTEDVPTVQHWWPLAYPDPVHRTKIRDEWFRRVQKASAEQAAIPPMEATVTCKDGSQREIEFFAAAVGDRHVVVFVDLTERKRAARQVREAQAEVQALSELLPVCAWCKKLRDDHGYWQQVEEFAARRTGATVTHGICPDCRSVHFAGQKQ